MDPWHVERANRLCRRQKADSDTVDGEVCGSASSNKKNVAKDHAARVRTNNAGLGVRLGSSRNLPTLLGPTGGANQDRKNRWIDYRGLPYGNSSSKTGGEKARARRDRTPSVAVRARAVLCRPRSLLLVEDLLACHRDAFHTTKCSSMDWLSKLEPVTPRVWLCGARNLRPGDRP